MIIKKKITELKEVRLRTVYNTDAFGNRYRDAEEWIMTRFVQPVTPFRRFGHYLIDSMLIQLITAGFASIIENFILLNLDIRFRLFAMPFFGEFTLAVFILYYSLFEYFLQQTPGKMITNTVVIDEYAERPSISMIVLRTLIRLVPFEPFSCWGDNTSRGWHDRWTKTWVVTKEERAKLQKLQEENIE